MKSAAMLSEQQIRSAMAHTLSNRAAARYLNVTWETYKKYAITYYDPITGKTLYELHNNKSGKGLLKHQPFKKDPALETILVEGMSIESYNITKLKHRLLHNGLLPHECSKCGFSEKRSLDFKVPILLNFKNGIKSDWRLENLEMLCYNCYFLNIGDIFTARETKLLEDFGAPKGKGFEVEPLDLDEDLLNRLETYTRDPNRGLDGSEFISRF